MPVGKVYDMLLKRAKLNGGSVSTPNSSMSAIEVACCLPN